MAKHRVRSKTRSVAVRYRAICENDNFKGLWRLTRKEAHVDARTHREKPGNQNHFLRIITEQTASRRFME